MIKVVAATTNLDLHGERFTRESLEQLAKEAINIPIMVDFDPLKPTIGLVTGAEVIDNQLILTCKLDKNIEGYIVPGFRVLDATLDKEDNLVFKDIEAIEFSIVRHPADPTLTEV